MLQVDQVLCLGSEALTSAVGRQTAFLAEILGSTIHVIPLNEGTPSGDLRDEPEQQYLGFSPSAELEVVSVPGSEIRSIEAIQRYAETQEVDLVIADAHADPGPIPPLEDSFVGALMRTLEQPIFCVSRAENPKEISRILVPTDLSDGSLKGLKHAAGLASVYGATVDLLHVIGRADCDQ